MTVTAAAGAPQPVPVAPAPAQRVGTHPGDYSPLAVIVDECVRFGFATEEILWSCRLLILGYLVGRARSDGVLDEERTRELVRGYLSTVAPSGGMG